MKHLIIILLLLANVPAAGQKTDSVRSGNVTVYYDVYGKGEPVYILSGGPGITPYSMHAMAEELSRSCQVVLVHQRGTGKTVAPLDEENLQIDKYCQDIRAVRSKAGHKQITLLGHSWGGMLAMHYATLYPDDVSKSILVGSGGYNLKFAGYFADNIRAALSADDQQSVRLLERYGALAGQHPPAADMRQEANDVITEYFNIILKGYFYDKSKAKEIALAPGDMEPMIGNLVIGSLGKNNWDLKSRLEQLNIKTLIIQGRQDPIDLETARDIHNAIKGSRLVVIERCGHFPWIEQPAAFYEAVRGFLW